MQVKQIMTNEPATCTRETSLQDAAKLMVDNDCGCLPVVDGEDSGIPVGMITDRDITTRIVAEGKNPLELTVQDAMTPAAFTVTPETSIDECCNLMEERQVRRVAVVDETGACCGMVSQADIALSAGRQQTGEVVQEVSKTTTA